MFAFTFDIIARTHATKRGNRSWEEKRKAEAKTQIFLSSQRTVSLIQRVLFMDQLLRVENKLLHSHCDTQRFIKLNLWACVSCVNKTTQLFWSPSKRCTASQRLFSRSWKRSLLLPLSTTLVQCLQCWLVLRLNRLQCFAPTHEPQNHQNRKGKELRNPLRIPL